MGYYLGILGTAKKSMLALADENGKLICSINALPLSMRVNSEFNEHLVQSIGAIASVVGLSYSELRDNLISLCIAASGVYLEEDEKRLLDVLKQIEFLQDYKVIICEDVFAHLASNFINNGGVIVAGTGSNVFIKLRGVNQFVRVDGWGSTIGDDGSGYYLGMKCISSLLKMHDGREEKSEQLGKIILDYIGLDDISDLVHWYYKVKSTVYWRSSISDLAIPLIRTAEQYGDRLAFQIVSQGATLLYDSFLVAHNKIINSSKQINYESLSLILEGGIFENSKIYYRCFENAGELSNVKWGIQYPLYMPIIGCLALAISGDKYINHTKEILYTLKDSATEFGGGKKNV